MAISYPLTFPTTKSPVSSSWELNSLVGILASQFTFQTQVQEHQGQRWEVNITLPIMDEDTAGDYRAFFAKLRGVRGTFLFGDHTRTAIKGLAAAAGLVNGASQSGSDLVTDGWANNVTGLFKAGDWVQLGVDSASRLYMVASDVNSDGSGNATITLIPEMREAPADNQEVIYSNCKGVFRLERNVVPIFAGTVQKYSRFSFSAVEAL